VRRLSHGGSAFLKIADGCSSSCAFCAIPKIKGAQCSKPEQLILDEARQLAARSVREIILIAQDTTAYGRDLGEPDALPRIIQSLLETVPHVPWLRLMYAYPQHVTSHLIETMATHRQVCHYLDLPLQHAHPETLRRMQRSPDMDGIHRLIGRLRIAMPDISLRTTFIVGYPGETEEEFVTLLEFLDEIHFDKVGIFTYSAEEHTAAAQLPGSVAPEEAQARHARAMELQQRISLQRNQEQIGRVLEVLVEGSDSGVSVARSYREAPEIDGYVLVAGQLPVGGLVRVKIEHATEYDLQGRVVDNEPSGLERPCDAESRR
jgi:ribosomal protein S12 methylthiotransferase